MNNRLTILLTNLWLTNLSGTVVVARDIAVGLVRRGHRPVVYSPELGAGAEEIAARGVSVIDDLRKLGEPPDIIHAHHSIPCGEALIRFPNVPAIYVCHDFTYWGEVPVPFPQIAAYVAVDETCRDRLIHTKGIDPKSVVVLPNAVDLRRIPSRLQPLRERPRRAMAFGKAAAVSELRMACEQLGIEYHALGAAAGREVAHPEQELVNFDLVFASARAALEAMCCGCAVIACDHRGIAGLVTSRNFDKLRTLNFGLRCLSDPVTVDRCIREIGGYDATDASLVTQRARDDADLEKLLDNFENLYADVLTGARRPRMSQDAHEQAVARFLHEYLPRRPNDVRWPWMIEKDHLQRERDHLQRQIRSLEALVADRDNQLALLKSSRLLKIGRLLRRLVGLPTPY
jgi:glycosyltransferase involved in cell wall biosynthesis